MTNKQILQASFIDLVFENRNKEYGAYALRKNYNKTLLVSLLSGSFMLLFFIMAISFNKKEDKVVIKKEIPGIVIREISLPDKKIEKVKKQEQVVKPKSTINKQPKLASVKFTSPPKITEVVMEPMVAIDNMEGKLIAANNKEGDIVEKNAVTPVFTEIKSGSGNESGPSQPETIFIIQERDPEFPGGADALRKFLGRYLSSPDNLEYGEKRVVKIKFKVDKDGSVNTFEIVTSGGFDFDNEVVRVCKKMPKWVPALQNGINVPVNYVLPVTFIGVKE